MLKKTAIIVNRWNRKIWSIFKTSISTISL